MGKFEKENLPVIDIKQLESLFADLILWYDKKYCKTKEGAYEVIGEYMTSDGRNEEPSESILNKHFVSNNEVAVCDHVWINGRVTVGTEVCIKCNEARLKQTDC